LEIIWDLDTGNWNFGSVLKNMTMLEETKEKAKRRRIGLFGGTFNPIHLGHLRGAEEIWQAFQLEKVIFIPSSVPPHKVTEKVMEAKHRLEMVKLATSDNPHFSTSDVELSRPGRSFSIDTIRFFRERHEDAFFFIQGGDAFGEIETWKDFQDLFSLCHFIVMARPGSQKNISSSPFPETLIRSFRYDPGERAWIHFSGHRVFFREISFLDISSTKVRELIEKGETARYLIPAEVETYIQKYRLYRKSP
jgi:nicotinate-nucleotide adenylyltransferase